MCQNQETLGRTLGARCCSAGRCPTHVLRIGAMSDPYTPKRYHIHSYIVTNTYFQTNRTAYILRTQVGQVILRTNEKQQQNSNLEPVKAIGS